MGPVIKSTPPEKFSGGVIESALELFSTSTQIELEAGKF